MARRSGRATCPTKRSRSTGRPECARTMGASMLNCRCHRALVVAARCRIEWARRVAALVCVLAPAAAPAQIDPQDDARAYCEFETARARADSALLLATVLFGSYGLVNGAA